ncbi:uncharacterized protein LOC120633341 [Pararge aegeria]|uniref:Jg14614 protein n=1 Tax=Pararge aegeria aegeria TaxID=348720 RepID=A0A8S4SNY0_9NEOP|nr:uncharacterized protein LOC120633341 [Pararge aegeria]CAH2269857.1 jg14614 [Pararge aegeria aegeria]
MQKKTSIDALHHILSSFRQFEKKLDKLQYDVSFHGQTLTGLSAMIANLSGTIGYEAKVDNVKVVNKTTTIDSLIEARHKTKGKAAVRSIPAAKVVTKSCQGQKYGLQPIKEPSLFNIKKMGSAAKRVMRQRKAEAPRKATTLRPKKISPNKSKSPPQNYEYPSQFKSSIYESQLILQ